MSICILSRYLGAIWAAKILKDWECNVTTQSTSKHVTVLVVDENTKEPLPSTDSKIVLTNVNVSSPHLLALSGLLSVFGQKQEMFVPKFLVQTTVSNALAILCLQTVYGSSKNKNQKSQSLNFSIIQALKYFGAFNISAKSNGFLNQLRGKNWLQGGTPYYSIYPCKEGHIVVGNLQPKFYYQMVKGLDLTKDEQQFLSNSQLQVQSFPKMRELLSRKFLQKTAREWQCHYKSYDTCITEIRAPFKSDIRQPKIIPLVSKL